jgi:hypothetical protein
MWRGSSAQSVVSVLTTSSSSMRHTCVASYFVISLLSPKPNTFVTQQGLSSASPDPTAFSRQDRRISQGRRASSSVRTSRRLTLSHSDDRTRGRLGEILRSLLIAFEAHILKRSVVALHRVDPRSRLRVRDRTPIEHGRLSRQLDECGPRSDSF